MAVIDAFTYNGETDLLELHIKTLAPYVDQFYVIESSKTFSGNNKPLYFLRDKLIVKKFWNKIVYFKVEENDDELWRLAESSPNTKGAEHWKREFVHKESIKKALRYIEDEDIVYIGDVDEIWDPAYKLDYALEKLLLRVYTYYLDNRSSEEFWGTLAGKWRFIKNKTLNHLRSDTIYRGTINAGWHFTSMGGLREVSRKLNDSYTMESYNTLDVQASLPRNIKDNKDFLGRDFTYWHDENEWPDYLKKNRRHFAHLCRSVKPDPVRKYRRGGYNT